MRAFVYFDRAQDRDLQNRVTSFLCNTNRGALRRLQVEAKDGTVILSGHVSSFYERQLAINCCLHVAGVLKLVDEVQVAQPDACVARSL